MKESEIREAIASGKTQLGIELGSTKIKAVLIDATFSPVASGSHDWKSTYENGRWTYSLEEVWSGLQDCYRNLAENVRRQYGVPLTTVGCIGFSAMEEVAFMDFHALMLEPRRGAMQRELLDKHYLRKHGVNAYYGQS